jgi:hypothetical protein
MIILKSNEKVFETKCETFQKSNRLFSQPIFLPFPHRFRIRDQSTLEKAWWVFSWWVELQKSQTREPFFAGKVAPWAAAFSGYTNEALDAKQVHDDYVELVDESLRARVIVGLPLNLKSPRDGERSRAPSQLCSRNKLHRKAVEH